MYELRELLEKQIDMKRLPTVYLAEGSLDKDCRPLAAASVLADFSKIMIVGNEDAIRNNAKSSKVFAEYADQNGITVDDLVRKTLDKVTVIDPESDAVSEKRKLYGKAAYRKIGEKIKKSEDEMIEMMKNPIYFSLMATAEFDEYPRDGHAVLGGLYSTTANFFAPGLRLHPKVGTVFEAGLFSFQDNNCPKDVYPGNIAVFGDVAVITEMTAERLADIAIGTCKIARDLLPEDDFPKIYGSIVSYSTKGSGDGPTIDMIRQAGDLISEKLEVLRKDDDLYKQIFITEEVQYAVAVNRKQAERKLDINDPKNVSAGKSNVIILPNLDYGNGMYHMHSAYYRDSQSILSVGGFKNNSILDFSRGQKIEGVILGGEAVILRLQYLKHFDPDPAK